MLGNNKDNVCSDGDCNNTFVKYKSTDKYCSWDCKIKNTKVKPKKKYVIPKISKKQKTTLASYFKVRADFMNNLESQVCPVYGDKWVTDVHHKKGKEGFADQWAVDNETSLLIDTRYFLAVSREGHDFIENNPTWAKERGFSEDRLSI